MWKIGISRGCVFRTILNFSSSKKKAVLLQRNLKRVPSSDTANAPTYTLTHITHMTQVKNASAAKSAQTNESAKAQVKNAAAKGAVKTAQKPVSLFVANWRVIRENIGGANWAYRAMYECASDELKAALIDPKTLMRGMRDTSNAYIAYANEHKGAKGVSAWFAYLWAQKEMREYLAKAPEGDKRAKAIAKVVRAERNEKQQKAVAKK